ncbi:MAG: hypothetical protein R6V28_01570 [Nitriliruptoraceae bacterium]
MSVLRNAVLVGVAAALLTGVLLAAIPVSAEVPPRTAPESRIGDVVAERPGATARCGTPLTADGGYPCADAIGDRRFIIAIVSLLLGAGAAGLVFVQSWANPVADHRRSPSTAPLAVPYSAMVHDKLLPSPPPPPR